MFKSVLIKTSALLIAIALASFFSPAPVTLVHAEGPPAMPQIFYGQVTLSGNPASAGASVVAKVGGTQFGATATPIPMVNMV